MNLSKLTSVLLAAFSARPVSRSATRPVTKEAVVPASFAREGGLGRLMEEADREARLLSYAIRPF